MMKKSSSNNIIPFPKNLSSEEENDIQSKNNNELRKYSFEIILKSLYEEACMKIDQGHTDSLYELLTSLSQQFEKNNELKKKILNKILNDLQTKKIVNLEHSLSLF
jgi:hypothetical protein